MRILVTGGCGFIGSHFIRLFRKERAESSVVNLDLLTYAASPDNLKDVEGGSRYSFVRGSIADRETVDDIVRLRPDAIINFAAESHVDRSLSGPTQFVRTNLEGTTVLLDAAKKHGVERFLQVSTDEVYGSLDGAPATEESTLQPNNPYSVTKAATDMMVLSYVRSFGLNAVITRSSNNYGPCQYPEKFIPVVVTKALKDEPCPIYGDGLQVRDWLHVRDNCRGIFAALERGRAGHVYNLGGGSGRTNLSVATSILGILEKPLSLLKSVSDRPGHDRKYALDSSKAASELGWTPEIPFETGLVETVLWYRRRFA